MLDIFKKFAGVLIVSGSIIGSVATAVILMMDRMEEVAADNREAVKEASKEGRDAVGDVVVSINTLNTTMAVQQNNMTALASELSIVRTKLDENQDRMIEQGIALEKQGVVIEHIKQKVDRAHP